MSLDSSRRAAQMTKGYNMSSTADHKRGIERTGPQGVDLCQWAPAILYPGCNDCRPCARRTAGQPYPCVPPPGDPRARFRVRRWHRRDVLVIALAPVAVLSDGAARTTPAARWHSPAEVHRAVAHDWSAPLEPRSSPYRSAATPGRAREKTALHAAVAPPPDDVEQTSPGDRPPPTIVASFDGLGAGFAGPQGAANFRNPSDNSLAVGPDHVVQIVNSRMAIFTKKGARYDTTGRVLYGPVETRNVFHGFGGPCEQRNNGDAVARYDQLANRWLIVMPIFSRITDQRDARPMPQGGEAARRSLRGVQAQPGAATRLSEPPPPPA